MQLMISFSESVVLIHGRLFYFMANLKPTVMKFGGTSVEDARAFERVADIVASRIDRHPVVVVSAISGMTNALVHSVSLAEDLQTQAALAALEPHFSRLVIIAQELLSKEEREIVASIERARTAVASLFDLIVEASAINPESNPSEAEKHGLEIALAKETPRIDASHRPRPQAVPALDGQRRLALRDAVLSFGEGLSSMLLAAVLRDRKVTAGLVDARKCIITDEEHGCAAPLMDLTAFRTSAELGPLLDQSLVPVLGGFIGATLKGETTTIGRGGSDYSAAIVGSVLAAREIQIWTDVTGVLTADPRVVAEARTIPRLSYAEAAELAYFGARVLHPKTMQPAVESNIPVRICNSRAPEAEGTLVCAESEMTRHTVKAIAHKTGVTTVQITSARMLGAYGFLRSLFEVFERHRTIVDVVTTSEVSVSLSLDDASALPSIVSELQGLGTVRVERERAIICVVGEGLRGTPGIAARVFNTIRDINVTLISQGASRINLTFAIEGDRVGEAVTRLHQAFFGKSNVECPESNAVGGMITASA